MTTLKEERKMDDYTHILKERLRELESAEATLSYAIGYLEAVSESEYRFHEEKTLARQLIGIMEKRNAKS